MADRWRETQVVDQLLLIKFQTNQLIMAVVGFGVDGLGVTGANRR